MISGWPVRDAQSVAKESNPKGDDTSDEESAAQIDESNQRVRGRGRRSTTD